MSYWHNKNLQLQEWWMNNKDIIVDFGTGASYFIIPLLIGYLVTFIALSLLAMPFSNPWSLVITIGTALSTFTLMLLVKNYLDFRKKKAQT